MPSIVRSDMCTSSWASAVWTMRRAEHGRIEEGQAEYIQNVFRFGELQVSDVMVHRTKMISVCADNAAEKVVNAALECSVTRVPLWNGRPENIIGVLHAKDVAKVQQGLRYSRRRPKS
jgi:CBS domain containing-hemolysin-like protein